MPQFRTVDLVTTHITGFDSLIAFIDTLPREITAATSIGLGKWGRQVMLTSRQKYVPVLKGDLIRSGRVNGPYTGPDGRTRLELDYTENYALDQHENLSYRHPRGGQAKYLEQAVDDHKDELLQVVRAELANIRK